MARAANRQAAQSALPGLLYETVQRRTPPERVACVLRDSGWPTDDPVLAQCMDSVARHDRVWSQSEDFQRPSSAVAHQIALIPVLFAITPPHDIELFIAEQRAHYGMLPSRRTPKHLRRVHGCFKSARWYNKRRHLLDAIERKVQRLRRAEELYLLTRVAKAALSVEVPRSAFDDLGTGALIAYAAARMNRRSAFVNHAQDRYSDTLVSALMAYCERSGTADWPRIALVLSDPRVLAHLTDGERGTYVGRWYALLHQIAARLRDAWGSGTDREQMIVRRGQDSTTWNALAGAWNHVRARWLDSLAALGAGVVYETVCPGKVMRLMAADVACWHEESGGQLHPDTGVWAALPLPWEVLDGTTRCGWADVRRACQQHGVDPATWGPRTTVRATVTFCPTPDLVHGVEVASPELAAQLRRAGVFSGRPTRGNVSAFEVVRDEHGAARSVYPTASSIGADGSAYRQDRE